MGALRNHLSYLGLAVSRACVPLHNPPRKTSNADGRERLRTEERDCGLANLQVECYFQRIPTPKDMVGGSDDKDGARILSSAFASHSTSQSNSDKAYLRAASRRTKRYQLYMYLATCDLMSGTERACIQYPHDGAWALDSSTGSVVPSTKFYFFLLGCYASARRCPVLKCGMLQPGTRARTQVQRREAYGERCYRLRVCT